MSKFAVLKVEGLSSSDDDKAESNRAKSKAVGGAKQNGTGASGSKKKNKKKKKASSGDAVNKETEDWKKWISRDQELVSTAYQRDLEAALLASRLAEEQQQKRLNECHLKQLQDRVSEQSAVIAGRERKQELLLHQQQQQQEQPEEETKPDLTEALLVAQQQLEEKEAIVSATSAELQSLKLDNKRLSDENAQLKSLIQLVEGKRGRGLCEQVSELTQVINELTEHIRVIDADLEKERSRCSQLQAQLNSRGE